MPIYSNARQQLDSVLPIRMPSMVLFDLVEGSGGEGEHGVVLRGAMEELVHTSATERPQGNACAASVHRFNVVCRCVYIFISDAVLSKETDTLNYALSTVHAWRDLLISCYERVASSDCSDDACGPRPGGP